MSTACCFNHENKLGPHSLSLSLSLLFKVDHLGLKQVWLLLLVLVQVVMSTMDKQVEANPSASSSPGKGREGPKREEDEGEGGGAAVPFEDRARAAQYPTFIGKHKLAASISHLHNQIDIIQKELIQLETVGESSLVCKELIASVESSSDPLLPCTKGPADGGWDRWFRGAHNSRSHNRWI